MTKRQLEKICEELRQEDLKLQEIHRRRKFLFSLAEESGDSEELWDMLLADGEEHEI